MFVDPCIIVQFLQWKIQQDATVYQTFIIPYFKWSQHVSGDTPPIIRSLKLQKQPLVLRKWEVVGRAVVGRCQVVYATWQRPTTARPITFYICKTTGCLCSFRLLMMGGVSPETCWASFKIRNNKSLIKFWYTVTSRWVFHCKNWTEPDYWS
jgi:hypothetical protein